jgi:hypothetical protein
VRGFTLLARASLLALLAIGLAPACSLGQGQGSVTGVLNVPDCWSGPFDLHPDFFAAIPATGSSGVPAESDSMQIRIQNGSDFQTFSDGLLVIIDDAGLIRGDSGRPSLLNTPLVVSLPPDIVPPGLPITPVANPRIVHAALYLNRTCRTQNDSLYALDAVTVNADGSCDRPDGGEPPLPCGAPATALDAGADAGAPSGADAAADAASEAGAGATGAAGQVRQSTIVFQSLFDGDPDESSAAKRYTNVPDCSSLAPGTPCGFDLYFANPREICPGGNGPPPRCRGHLTGWFNFYFQRGKPAQPFP